MNGRDRSEADLSNKENMLHHLSIAVSNLDRSSAFYDAVLKPLGYIQVFADDEAVGYGYEGGDDKLCLKRVTQVIVPGDGFHLAFTATAPNQVHEFHTAALLHGGRCNGAPGPRPEYGDGYYAAFVFDPEKYRIEAVINLTA
jgi:catechol 2,3-dioxygenase-like lactoylglutathione lyase family enzyme